MAINDLTAPMLVAGLSTARQSGRGQPEHSVETLDDVAALMVQASRTP